MLLRYKLHDLRCEIRWAFQRMFRGYDDRAVWNVNTWFLETMPKILTQLKEEHMGYPPELSDKKWEAILDKMITCFKEANEDTCTKENKYQEEYDKAWNDFTKAYGFFGDKLPQPEECKKEGSTKAYFPDSPEINRKDWQLIVKNFLNEDKKIANYRDKKLHEGLDLFNQYFWNLWD